MPIRPRPARRWRCAPLLLVAALGCGAGPGLVGDVYRGDGFAFAVEAPGSGWQPLEASPAALAYRHEAANAQIMVHARCGKDGDDVPLQALHAHLFLQFTDRVVHVQETVPFDGREALHTELTASLDGVPRRYDVWVLKKDGCVYDLLYMAPEESFEQGRGAFAALVDNFATVEVRDGG